MRARGASEVKLENQPKQEKTIKRQRSIDLRGEDNDDEDGEVTIISVNSTTRGKRSKVEHLPDTEILDLTGD